MLDKDQVVHIAKLARLGLKEGDSDKFSTQLNDILSYVDKLSEVDTEGVLGTSQVTGLENVTRDDSVEKFCERADLLACTELPVEQDQIKVKPVITEN
ncbi:Asp-tRNA(Asn)/Glu-tRNA(Gln) amidotransferase subunit GatC [Candidatus Peregrinibacteria bacterium]|nr:Asp-tRNA(Asn)/Glu-tRNA(Gln) amidotransferase subunit GatC [Candidatus Peregrinibacteria bacterium]